jgi:hypothetical protein
MLVHFLQVYTLTPLAVTVSTMESIGDLLSRYKPQEPEEITAVKQYISDEFGVTSNVGLQGETALIITIPSAALANTLRMRTTDVRLRSGS